MRLFNLMNFGHALLNHGHRSGEDVLPDHALSDKKLMHLLVSTKSQYIIVTSQAEYTSFSSVEAFMTLESLCAWCFDLKFQRFLTALHYFVCVVELNISERVWIFSSPRRRARMNSTMATRRRCSCICWTTSFPHKIACFWMSDQLLLRSYHKFLF